MGFDRDAPGLRCDLEAIEVAVFRGEMFGLIVAVVGEAFEVICENL